MSTVNNSKLIKALCKIRDTAIGLNRDPLEVWFVHRGKRLKLCLPYTPDLIGIIAEVFFVKSYELLLETDTAQSDYGVIIDAGSHVGLYTLKASVAARNVVALEPHPRNYGFLLLNLERNRVNNVIALNAALWSRGGTSTLFEGRGGGQHSIVKDSLLKGMSVRTLTLQDVVNLYCPDGVDVLKMDVEGAELEILANLTGVIAGKINAIVCELHPWVYGVLGLRRLVQKLRRLGFTVQIVDPLRFPLNYRLRRMLETRVSTRRLKAWLLAMDILTETSRFQLNRLRFDSIPSIMYACRKSGG